MSEWLNIRKQIIIISHNKRIKKKLYIIIQIDTEKSLDKIQQPFREKRKKNSLHELGKEKNKLLQQNKGHT